jgi:hypothetical protein
VRKADNLPTSCADVKKYGGLNLLEPCGPVQACNGTALPFTFLSPVCHARNDRRFYNRFLAEVLKILIFVEGNRFQVQLNSAKEANTCISAMLIATLHEETRT